MPDWSNCEFMLPTRRPVFDLVLRLIFPELQVTSGQLYCSDVMILLF